MYGDGTKGGRATEVFTSLQSGSTGQDCNGHGTHVAAVVAGLTFGVAKNATLPLCARPGVHGQWHSSLRCACCSLLVLESRLSGLATAPYSLQCCHQQLKAMHKAC